jgi:hypothetical protein
MNLREKQMKSASLRNPLKTKSAYYNVRVAQGTEKDPFSENAITQAMHSREKETHPEFYNVKSMGKLIKADCPGLEDDYYNKQKLV